VAQVISVIHYYSNIIQNFDDKSSDNVKAVFLQVECSYQLPTKHCKKEQIFKYRREQI